MPSKCVKKKVTAASASVTESDEVAAKMPQTGNPCQVSPVSGSGMNPIRLTTKMNRKSDATYGNQRPSAFEGSPCSAICDCATS